MERGVSTMKMSNVLGLSAAALAMGWASASFAGVSVAPSPVLGAGLPGLAILAVTGAGYLAVRMRRRGRD
jgi:hypothetical protein